MLKDGVKIDDIELKKCLTDVVKLKIASFAVPNLFLVIMLATQTFAVNTIH